MPRPAQRTDSFRKIRTRTPGGKTVIHYEKRKPGIARCAICGKPLRGVPRLRVPVLRRLSKTKKRPERPYGGYICHECLANLLRMKIREEAGIQ